MHRRMRSKLNQEERGAVRRRSRPERQSTLTSQEAVKRLSAQVGNRAVQRLVSPGARGDAYDLEDELAGRIERQRGSGGELDAQVRNEIGAAYGWNFNDVRVHTGQEADQLNRELNAKAFTTGQDIYFRQGAYEPGSSQGRELLSHELAHVVQQGSGQVTGAGKMNVHAPDDRFERQADQAAEQVRAAGEQTAQTSLQMQAVDAVQLQELEEEEELQMQEMDEEEEMLMS